jgi:hypothetical protein
MILYGSNIVYDVTTSKLRQILDAPGLHLELGPQTQPTGLHFPGTVFRTAQVRQLISSSIYIS